MYPLIVLGLVCLIAPLFAKYGDYLGAIKIQLNWVAQAGLWFLLAAAFGLGYWADKTPGFSLWATRIFHLLGWLWLIIAGIWSAFFLTRFKK